MALVAEGCASMITKVRKRSSIPLTWIVASRHSNRRDLYDEVKDETIRRKALELIENGKGPQVPQEVCKSLENSVTLGPSGGRPVMEG